MTIYKSRTDGNSYYGTSIERATISAVYEGMVFIESDTNKIYKYLKGSWVEIGSGPFTPFFNGIVLETFDALATSNGTIVTMTLEQSGGGDLTMVFSDGQTILDCTPAATVTLTAGTDTVPVSNYVYIPVSTKVLTVSTTGFPTTEHIKIAYFFLPSATHIQSEGAYINQNWNDHVQGTNAQGHLSHITERIRRFPASWFSGIDPAGTDQAAATSYFNYVAAAEAYFKSSAGVIYQMHRHTYPAVDTQLTDETLHVVNWNGDSYHELNNIADIVADSTGTSLSNKYFNLFFFAVGNKTGEYAPIMCMLPSGGYSSLVSAQNDVDGYDNLNMPREFGIDSSTGIPICRMTLRWSGGTSTLSHESTTDLRGSAGAGGTPSSGSFLTLTDTPVSYTGEAGRLPYVNTGETALEFSSSVLVGNGIQIGSPIGGDKGTGTINTESDIWCGGDLTFQQASTISAIGQLTIDATGGIVINEDGDDEDVRVEGITEANLFRIDAGNDRVGIGTASPLARLQIVETSSATSPRTGLNVNTTFSPTSSVGVFPQSLMVNLIYDSAFDMSGGFILGQYMSITNAGNGVADVRGLDILYTNTGTGTVVNVHSVRLRTHAITGGGAITTSVALYIENVNTATNNYAIFAGTGLVSLGDNLAFRQASTISTVGNLTLDPTSTIVVVDGAIRLGTTTDTTSGNIRWTGSDFEGYTGAAWTSLTSGGGGGLVAHAIDGIYHTVTGSQWDLVGLTAANTIGLLTPSDDPGTNDAILKTASTGALTLALMHIDNTGAYAFVNASALQIDGALESSTKNGVYVNILHSMDSALTPNDTYAAMTVLLDSGTGTASTVSIYAPVLDLYNYIDDVVLSAIGARVKMETSASITQPLVVGFEAMFDTLLGTATNYQAIAIRTPTNSFALGTLVNSYGLYIEDMNAGTTLNYAIYTGIGTVSLGDDLEFRQASTISTTAGLLTLAPYDGVILTTSTATSKILSISGSTTYAVGFRYDATQTSAINGTVAVLLDPTIEPSTGVTVLYGMQFLPYLANSSNSLSFAFIGQLTRIATTASYTGTVPNGYAHYIADPIISGGSLTTNYGIYIASMTAGTLNYAIYTGTGSISFGDDLTFRQASTISTTAGDLTLSPTTELKINHGVGGYARVNCAGDSELRISTIGGSNNDSTLSFYESTVARANIYWDGATNDFHISTITGNITLASAGGLTQVNDNFQATGYSTLGSIVATASIPCRISYTQAHTTGTSYGLLTSNYWSGTTNSTGVMIANELRLTHNVPYNISTGTGTQFSIYLTDVGGSITTASTIKIINSITGSISSLAGVRISDISGGGTVTTQYGIYIAPLSGASSNYAIYTNTGLVYFGDDVGIGIQPVYPLHVSGQSKLNGNVGINVNPQTNYALYTNLNTGDISSTAIGGQLTGTATSANIIYGAIGSANINRGATTHNNTAIGVTARVAILAAQTGSVIGSNYSIVAEFLHQSTAAVTNAQLLRINQPSITAGGSIGTAYGLYVSNFTAATTNYAIYTNSGIVRFGDVVTTTDHVEQADAYFSAYDNTGGLTINATGTWVSVPWDTVNRKDAMYTHSTSTNPHQITLTETGDYKITVDVSTYVTTGTARSVTALRVTVGGVEISGTRAYMYNRITTVGHATGSVTFIYSATAGNVISVEVTRIGGTDTMQTIADGSRIMIERI